MNPLQENPIRCPYCGESITVLIDVSPGEQEYVEDCEVCCRPMVLRIFPEPDGSARVLAGRED
jgi:hypothetical protein